MLMTSIVFLPVVWRQENELVMLRVRKKKKKLKSSAIIYSHTLPRLTLLMDRVPAAADRDQTNTTNSIVWSVGGSREDFFLFVFFPTIQPTRGQPETASDCTHKGHPLHLTFLGCSPPHRHAACDLTRWEKYNLNLLLP